MCAIFLPHYGDKEASLINIFIFRNVRVLFANEVKFRRIFYAFILNLNLKLKLRIFASFFFFKQKLSRLFWIISEGFLLDFCLQEHYGSGKKKKKEKKEEDDSMFRDDFLKRNSCDTLDESVLSSVYLYSARCAIRDVVKAILKRFSVSLLPVSKRFPFLYLSLSLSLCPEYFHQRTLIQTFFDDPPIETIEEYTTNAFLDNIIFYLFHDPWSNLESLILAIFSFFFFK